MDQLKKIKTKLKGMCVRTYIAAFEDGSVSEPISDTCVPPPCEGDYVRIEKNDTNYDIIAKLGSLGENKYEL